MKPRLARKLIALFLGLLGLAFLVISLAPIVLYEIESRQKYPILISPISDKSSLAEKFSLKGKDYTKASNWFEGGVEEEKFASDKITFYTISIPKLRIEDATVSIGGEDLSKSLIQYPGTALPGEIGNSVIFGHSILPIFFNPKNYLSIFSTLPKLDKGDKVYVNFDGILYTYQVETMFEVYPNNIEILEQNPSNSYLTLVTCVPPGDPRKARRLIVRAKLVPAVYTYVPAGYY